MEPRIRWHCPLKDCGYEDVYTSPSATIRDVGVTCPCGTGYVPHLSILIRR